MHPRHSFYFLALSIFPLFLALKNPHVSEGIHSFSLTLMKPALVAMERGVHSVSHVRGQAAQVWKMFRDQKVLEDRVAQLESKLVFYDETVRENERLRKLLQFQQVVQKKSVAARIIGWDISPWHKTMILDKGTRQGIRKNMVVVDPQGLVGKISEVGPSTSRLLLLIDPDSRVSAVSGNSRAQGVLAGNGSLTLNMGYLEISSGVSVEEFILTSGVGGIFPKGLRIGKIKSVGKARDGLHLVAQVEPFVAFSKLEEVLCLEFSQRE